MLLSQRERNIAIVAAAAVVLLLGFLFVYTPLSNWHDRIVADRQDVDQKLDDAKRLFSRQERLLPVWRDLLDHGLKSTPSEADSEVQEALLDWAQDSHLELTSLKSARPVQDGQFQQVTFHVTGAGPMRTVAQMLWRIETAPIPVKINEMQITPRKEGIDDLQVQLSISTICLVGDNPSNKTNRNRSVASTASLREQP